MKPQHIRIAILGAIALGLFFGFYHITNVGIISRPYFGFSDIIGNTSQCTNGPWIIVKAQHPSLCQAFQELGYIESNEEMQERVKNEIIDDARKVDDCTSKCNFDDDDCFYSCL